MRTILAFLIALLAAAAAPAADQDRPNILWLVTEDNGPHFGCYGFDYAHTPNLDAFAKKSLLYSHAFATAGVCAPARSTLITSMYPPCLGSEHMRSSAKLPDQIKFYSHYLREAGYYCTNNAKEDYNIPKPPGAWDDSSGKAHYNKREPGQPFFAIFNYGATHESKIRQPEKQSFPHHKIEDAPVPPYHPDTRTVKRDWAQYHANLSDWDEAFAKRLEELEKSGEAENTIIFYYGDHGSGMPRNKRWLWDSGIHVPLIVHVPDKWKHLIPEGEKPGVMDDRLVSFVDFGATALSLAGVEPPAHMQGRAFLGKFAAPPREYIHAFRGRMDERLDFVRAVRDHRYKLIRNFNPHQIYGQHIAYMFQTKTTSSWKKLFDEGKLNAAQSAFWQTKPPIELYDCEADPHEINNLANSPEHAEVKARLLAELDRWQLEIGDLGFLPEGEMHLRAGSRTFYELGQDRAAYDLPRIKAAADLASLMDPANLPKLREFMADNDSAVRYWGALGCVMLGEKAAPAAGDLVKALDDPAPNVSVAAAEALFKIGKDEDKALAALDKANQHKNDFVRLHAINVLDSLDEKARPIFERIKAAKDGGDKAEFGPYKEGYVNRVLEKAMADLGL